MNVCPECGERATLESYEAWTPAGGWKKLERISCMNVRPKQGEPCGKKTILNETPLDREASPVLSAALASDPASRRSANRPSRSAARSEQPTPEAHEADAEAEEEAEEEEQEAQEVQDRLEQPDTEAVETEKKEPVDADETDDSSDDSGANNDPGNRRFPKYSAEQYQRLIELVEGGMTCPQASTTVGIQVNTAYGIIGKYRRGVRAQNPTSAVRRPVLTLVPSRTSGGMTTSVARLDAPFKASTLLEQLQSEGITSPGRMLNSDDLAAYFRLSTEVQEGLRLFHAMRTEVAAAERWTGGDCGPHPHLA